MAHTPRQISASQIRPGATIILRGQIEYARVRSLLGPADIEKLNRARTKSEPLDVNKPITRLALHHAEVVPQDPSGKMTPEEYYVWERMFETPDKPELGRRWNIDNKGTVLPVLLKTVDGTARQITDDEIPASPTSLPTEPERDQLVTVVLNVYDTKRVNKGIGIQAIIFNEEPRWYTGSSSVNNTALAALGITLSGPIVAHSGVVANEPETAAPAQVAAPVAPVAPAVPAVPAVPQAAPQNTVVDAASGLAMPAPVTQPVAPAPAAQIAALDPQALQALNPQALQILNAITQQQSGSAFTAPAAPAAPTEEAASSPWTID